MKRELRVAIERVRLAGAQMSNVCFNLGQRPGEPLAARDAEIMRRLCAEWDSVNADFHRLAKPKHRTPRQAEIALKICKHLGITPAMYREAAYSPDGSGELRRRIMELFPW